MEQEVGQAPAVPVLKNPVAVSVSLVLLYVFIRLFCSLYGNGSCGEGRIIWDECSKVWLGLSCDNDIFKCDPIPWTESHEISHYFLAQVAVSPQGTAGQENATIP